MTDKPVILLDQSRPVLSDDQQQCVHVLKEALEQAEAGNIDTIGVIACMKGGYASVMGGSRAGDLALGTLDLQQQILDATRGAKLAKAQGGDDAGEVEYHSAREGVMGLIERLKMLRDKASREEDGFVHAVVCDAIDEIERLRSLAGAVTAGPSAAETLSPLRHKAPSEFDRGFAEEWERQKVLIRENQERLDAARKAPSEFDAAS